MRVSERDKQKMYYSLLADISPIYELDEDGNKIIDFTDEEGNIFYRETGAFKTSYTEPIEFWASISSNLNEMHCREFGVDQSSIYAQLCVPKNMCLLSLGQRFGRIRRLYGRTKKPKFLMQTVRITQLRVFLMSI